MGFPAYLFLVRVLQLRADLHDPLIQTLWGAEADTVSEAVPDHGFAHASSEIDALVGKNICAPDGYGLLFSIQRDRIRRDLYAVTRRAAVKSGLQPDGNAPRQSHKDGQEAQPYDHEGKRIWVHHKSGDEREQEE